MHELSLCRALVEQVSRLAIQHRARGISRIRLAVGPLAGVEIALLRAAFPHGCRDTFAAGAVLEIEQTALRARCEACNAISDVDLNQLRCRECGDWRTQLVSGDELLLQDVEFIMAAPAGEHAHVR